MSENQTDKKESAFQYPQVTFTTNIDLNVTVLNNFIARGTNRGGANFKEIILKNHPELEGTDKLSPEDRLQKVKDYVYKFYENHKTNIDNGVAETNKSWSEYAPQFFNEVKKLFGNLKWPEGEYKGFATITAPFPRFLDTKTFCTTYAPDHKTIAIAAHEMLHFIFFEYVRQRYLPDMTNTIQYEMEERLENRFTIPIWELSEIFNIVVLSGDEWGIATAKQSTSSYNHLKKYVPEFEKLWKESEHNIDKLFTQLEKN